MLFIIAQFILLLILSLNIWQLLPPNSNCNIIVIVIVTLYHLTKSLFYGISIARLKVAFESSLLEYNTCTINSMYVFVCLYSIFISVGTPFVIYGVWIEEPVTWCHVHVHVPIYCPISIGLWIFMDVVISGILCYLFIRPMKRILHDDQVQDQGFFIHVYVKYTILTYISIILNMIGLLLYLFKHLTILIAITAAINCICIVLMYRKYQPIFDVLCGCVVKCCINFQKHPIPDLPMSRTRVIPELHIHNRQKRDNVATKDIKMNSLHIKKIIVNDVNVYISHYDNNIFVDQ